MSEFENLVAALQQPADNPDPADSETTGGTDEALESQAPEEDFELEAEQDGVAAEADEQDDESDTEEWYTVKVGGEELQVTKDELLSGYQRDADYRKKTMTLAEERKAVEAEKSRLSEVVSQVDAFIKREEESIDWDALKKENPEEFIAKKDALEAAKKARQAAVEEQQKYLQELVKKESQLFLDAMGGDDAWSQEQRNVDMQVASEYLTSKGFKDEEVSQIIDHKLWTVIMDAAKAQKYAKTEAKVKEEVRKAPKSVKPGQKLPAGERKRQEITKRIKSSRNSQDQVAALTELIKLQG